MKIEVKYNGVVVGHTIDGKIIEFLDNDVAKEVKEYLMTSQIIGVSSRAKVDNYEDEISDYDIIDYSLIKK